MQLGRHSRIDYASPSLLQRHRNRCPCACSRGFARCRGVARVTTSFRLPNIANSNLEASPKFSRFWFEGFASVETSPIFVAWRLRRTFPASIISIFWIGGFEASFNLYSRSHVCNTARPMRGSSDEKSKPNLQNLWNWKKGKINTHKWEIRETKWATQSICQHCKLYTPTTTHHTRKHISRKCHTWHAWNISETQKHAWIIVAHQKTKR